MCGRHSSREVCRSQAPHHPSHTVVDGCYDPACACKATTSDVGTAVRQILRCYHPQGKRLFLRACFPQYMNVPVPEGMREVDILGFSAGSYTGLAIHEVLNEFACFPGTTKVAAIASPPEMLRLTTGERRVILSVVKRCLSIVDLIKFCACLTCTCGKFGVEI